MKVRLAEEEDFAWMLHLQRAAKLPFWKPNATTWVVGKSAFAVWQKIGDECELLSISVMKRNRRKGYAKQLLEHGHKQFKRLGVVKFFLEVRESNEAAISLYTKFGYERIAERKGYYSDSEKAVIMSMQVQ